MSKHKGTWLDTDMYAEQAALSPIPEKGSYVTVIYDRTPVMGKVFVNSNQENIADRFRAKETGPTAFYSGLL